jgi:hypothetical protein
MSLAGNLFNEASGASNRLVIRVSVYRFYRDGFRFEILV